ncbi:Uncharacterized protein DAT39_007019, partial [Clarias magur]
SQGAWNLSQETCGVHPGRGAHPSQGTHTHMLIGFWIVGGNRNTRSSMHTEPRWESNLDLGFS